MPVPRDRAPDSGIDVPGRKYPRPRRDGQHRHPRLGSLIERFGLAKQPRHERSQPRIVVRGGAQRVGCQPDLAQPVERQVDSASTCVLADVAGDVRQLHRDPQVACAGERVRIAYPHQHAHHRADRRGDTCGIGEDVRQRLVAPPARVPGETFQQSLGQRPRHRMFLDHAREGPVRRHVPRPARIAEIETVAQREDGSRLLLAFVHGVVGEPAERVERQRRIASSSWKQL